MINKGPVKTVISKIAVLWVFGGKGQRASSSGHIPFDLDSDESAVSGLVM